MKGFRSFCLAVLVITVNSQFGASYPIGNGRGGQLLLDNDGMGQKNGSSVNITESGALKVFLERNGLLFKVCTKNCNADVLICYEGDSANQTVVEECASGCGFYVTTKDDFVSVMLPMDAERQERKIDECESFVMGNGNATFRGDAFTSCVPKTENGMVKLNVSMASSDCPILTKNAFVLPESTAAPPTTSTPESANFGKTSTTKSGASGANNGTSVEDSPTFMSSYWWIFLIIGLILVAGIVIGVLLYCFVFKKEKKPTTVQPGQAASRTLARPKTKIVLPPPEEEEENKRPKLPSSIIDPSSILSRKSLLDINQEEPQQQLEPKKEEAPQSTDLKSINVAA